MKLFFIICFTTWLHSISALNEGFINCPVADLFGRPLNTDETAVPVCGYPQASAHCPRLHQLLFNEPVTIMSSKGDYLLVTTHSSYFITHANPQPKSEYWIKASCVTRLDSIAHKEKIPGTHSNLPTITLARPWTDRSSGIIYSAGTRFACAKGSPHGTGYHVFIYQPHTHRFATREVETTAVVSTGHNKKNDYVQLIRDWIRTSTGVLPYVWGGTSIVTACAKPFSLHTQGAKEFFDYPDATGCATRTGCDCSGLVWRAAHTVGINYRCKNTYTLAQKLPVVHSMHELAVGDLMWIPGHVMIVADLEKNTMIEARSYKHGYGKLHEIPLSEQFQGITTYEQLLAAQNSKRPLRRLDAQGTVTEILKEFKLLSFPQA